MTIDRLRKAAAYLLALILLSSALPAHAEKLTFDHRLYPALKEVLDSGDSSKIDFNASNPRYVTDFIVIRGGSPTDWSEAIEIVSRSPSKAVGTARAWVDEQNAQANAICANSVALIAEDAGSMTFSRHLPGCPKQPAETQITRIVAGKRSLFEIMFRFKNPPDEAVKRQALAMLASAHLD